MGIKRLFGPLITGLNSLNGLRIAHTVTLKGSLPVFQDILVYGSETAR